MITAAQLCAFTSYPIVMSEQWGLFARLTINVQGATIHITKGNAYRARLFTVQQLDSMTLDELRQEVDREAQL